ncbi:hypothetical protein, partial [uncultured Sphingomonas sp.]|uniref:hypothetical protein n=1 Tax=uncultured Sphingomonas sp. TaxID=158754 RepID=UPI0035CAA950
MPLDGTACRETVGVGMLKRFWKTAAAGLALVAAGVGIGAWREAHIGRGAMDGSGPARGGVEVALVANGVGGTVSFIDLATGRVRRTLDVTPDGKTVGLLRDPVQYVAQPKIEARGGKNYAQDTDLSRDGRILYVS